MSSNPYLDALHQQQVDFLKAYQTATPEQKAQIQQVADGGASSPQPTTPSNVPAGTIPGVTYRAAPDDKGGATYVGDDGKTYSEAGYAKGEPPTDAGIYESYEDASGQMWYRTLDGSGGVYSTGGGGSSSSNSSKKDDPSVDQGALGYLTDLLRKYGLDSLAGWAMDQIKAGATQYEIIQALRQRPEYKTRFAGMDQRAAKGLGALSEDEYIAFENTTKDFLQRAGITGYRTPTELANLIGNFANVGQVADRVQKGYQQVAQAPPEVRQEMQKWFGVDGDGALAAFFLDPEKAEPMIIKAAQTAVIGGTGLRQGLDVTQGMAGRLADLGMTNDQIQGGFGQAGLLGDLQYQTIDENSAKAAGLTADTLASGVFGLEGSDSQAIKDRLDTRKAQFDTRGEAGASQKGAFGLGIAQ